MPPGSRNFPGSLDDVVSLYEAANMAVTTLSSDATSGASTLYVASTSKFPNSGSLLIDNEFHYYTGKTSTTFTGVVGAQEGTSLTAHLTGATVEQVMSADQRNVLRDVIILIEQKLGTGSSTPTSGTVLTGTGTGTSAWQVLAAGPTGPIGAQGSTGPTGPQGTIGAQGATGSPVVVYAATQPSSPALGQVWVDTADATGTLDYTANVNAQTGTTYTLVSTDNGKVVTFSNASAITVTVPTGLGAGFNATLVQLGAGQVTVSPSSTTILNRQSHTRLAGQYAAATLLSHVANTFVLAGDTTA